MLFFKNKFPLIFSSLNKCLNITYIFHWTSPLKERKEKYQRHSSKSLPCEPAPLPKDRVEAQYAFQTTGVDLAGPLILKGGMKVWIVLYTCAVFQVVYLDIVDS